MAKTKTPAAATGSEMDLFGVGWPRLVRWPEWMHRLDNASIRLEEFDEDSTHIVRAEMPGIDPDKDVNITVDHGVLTISAERHTEKTSDDKGHFRSEFSYGSFARSLSLPSGASEDDVKASYHDGILEIRFPIDGEVAESSKIPVTRS